MQNIFNHQLSHLVRADIVFGSPRRDCRNLGICKIDSADLEKGKEVRECCPAACANILIDAHGRLLMLFPEKDISETVAAKHFFNDTFTVEDAYSLTPRMCRLLGRPGGRLTIMSGSFPVIKLGEGFLLSLPLLAVSQPVFGPEEVFDRMLDDAIAS